MWMAIGVGTAVLAFLAVLTITRLARDAAVAEYTKLVARQLHPAGSTPPALTQAEILSGLAISISDSKRLARRGGELGEIAAEYGAALEELERLLRAAPSLEPLVDSGLDVIRGRAEGDDIGLFLGLLSGAGELNRFASVVSLMEVQHARIVACRLRMAEILRRDGPSETASFIEARFEESGLFSSVRNDTLTLTNTSDDLLKHAAVLVELTGKSGERFVNLFYVERWPPKQSMIAVCPSDRPFRETVSSVRIVRCRVITTTATSPLIELKERK
jgi:hypothetical protein